MKVVKRKRIVITKQIVLTECEATFLRDLLGGIPERKAFEYIKMGYNLGNWTEKEAGEQFWSLINDLDDGLENPNR